MSGQDSAGRAAAIAVVGLAGRFPGAGNPAALWANLRAGVESITFFSDEQLLAAGESPDRLRDPAYVRACGRLDGIADFDAGFFGMSPRDAAVFDPQHRLFLECAWEAFEDAGYVGERVKGPVAVFAATGAPEYMMHNLLNNRQVMTSVGEWLVRHTGNDQNFLATRVSYELNLNGPSLNVQTACSSSLTAIHLACQSLLNGECDMALAGGSTIYPEQNRGYFYKEGEILSPDGHCRAFDAQSAGTVMSSAVGCVILKRLEDAERDLDQVLAIVRGSAINNDGSEKVGYLAPSVSGQTRVVSEALAIAGVHPDEVSYIEAHGTGTLLGDPIEIRALTQAYRPQTTRKEYCAIGSIKTNIGHSGEAAGVCGFIKTVLALQHREIPPSLHYQTPNPKAELADSPFFVNARLREWTVPSGASRIAGVTALGAGGTNVHVIVEEAPRPPAATPSDDHQLLVLSARTPAALDVATRNLAAHLRATPGIDLADVAYTLLEGRKAFAYRRIAVVSGAADAVHVLETADRKRLLPHHHTLQSVPAAYFMFPGGGAQYARMGADLYAQERPYREAFDEALSHLEPDLRAEVRALVFCPPVQVEDAGRRLEAPSRALPALLATEYAMVHLLHAWGITPMAMVGHSAGEYAAACVSGVISIRDAMGIVALRGRLFETLAEGAMLSVALSVDAARAFMSADLSIAAVNAPAMCVLSGPVDAVARAEQAVVAAGIDCARVHINVAAHSMMVEPILPAFERFCRTIAFKAPTIPFVSNVTGTWITDAEATDPAYWVKHLRSTVRFADGVQTVLESGVGACVEIGPGRTLSSLVRQQAQRPAMTTPTLRHPDEARSDVGFILGAVGHLWAAGVPLDTSRLWAGQARRRVALPTYPFERQRYWIDPDPQDARPATAGPPRKQRDIADWFWLPSWVQTAPRPGGPVAPSGTWLFLRSDSTLDSEISDGLRRTGDRVIEVVAGERFEAMGSDRYRLDPGNRAHFEALAVKLKGRPAGPLRLLHAWALTADSPGSEMTLPSYRSRLARDYFSLVHAAHVFAADGSPFSVYCLSSRLQGVVATDAIDPGKAVLLGPCQVIPREYPHVACVSIDVEWPSTAVASRSLRDRLLHELRLAPIADREVALRGKQRWARRFDRVRLPESIKRDWFRAGGTYVITGGLGGIALKVAEHLARSGGCKLALIGRTALPPEAEWDRWIARHDADDDASQRIGAVRTLRGLGADVMTVAADVSRLEAMRQAIGAIRARFGRVHGVFHAAGVLHDGIIALRDPAPESPTLDAKVKGALVLDQTLADDPPEIFVLFSSVSSILGLPGQSDYTAANRFLDAFACARDRRGTGRTISINWNAWQDVGMLAGQVRQLHPSPTQPASAESRSSDGTHPMRRDVARREGTTTVTRALLSRRNCWVIGEHVVRTGEAVLPGTGFLDFVLTAFNATGDRRAVELRDVLFLAPFAVSADETRALHIRIDENADHAFSIYGDTETEPYVVGRIAGVERASGAPIDLTAIGARCSTPGPAAQGRLVQSFMEFGPRWSNVTRIDLGVREALVTLDLPAGFVADLGTFPLHPALLDMATGGAQAIVPGFDPATTFYVPFSYGSIVFHGPLTRRVVSHVRLREEGTSHGIAFDVTVCDADGHVLVSIDRFVMRRAAAGFAAERRATVVADPRSPLVMTPAEAALREGMSPAEGLEALDRVLAVDFAPQVVVCTVPIDRWLERVEAEAHAEEPQGNGLGKDGPVFSRPNVASAYAAPRDEVERDLAELWSGLLGIAEVGINDDFFELGGKSLVAVRLFQRIAKKFGVDLPLATLFQAPTIAECAALVRERLAPLETTSPTVQKASAHSGTAVSGTPSLKSLVMIQRGSGGTPLFILHGAGGNVLNLRDLARGMDQAQAVYGMQAYGTDGVTPAHHTIEEMASAYWREIATVQPHGPYLLAGYSGGGIVAFELAKRMTAAGEAVGLLALIDTYNPETPERRLNVRTRLDRLRKEGVSYVRGAIERKLRSAQQARDERIIEERLAAGEAIPLALRELHLFRTFERAAARYQLKPWKGKATLFRPEFAHYLFDVDELSYGWDRYMLEGVEVVKVPGDHQTLLLGANAERIVRALEQAIAQAVKGSVQTSR